MWREFDATAQEVLFQARLAAAAHGFEFMEDVHLLEGIRRAVRELTAERPSSSQLLEQVAETARDLEVTEAGTEDRPVQHPGRVVRFGESAMRTLQSATELAKGLGHRHVQWAHILLALSEGGSDAVRSALRRASLTPVSIRQHLANEPR